jgi:hypothetical protein
VTAIPLLRRLPLLSIARDDHPGPACLVCLGHVLPSQIQRGYPHDLIPAAEPWQPRGARRG